MRKTPFAGGVLYPDNLRPDEEDPPDDEMAAEERPEFDPELKAFRLEKITADLPRLLRDGDAVQLQPAPGGDADLA